MKSNLIKATEKQCNQERELCLQCFKCKLTCYCEDILKIKTNLQIILLQHPLERKKAIGTARMTHLCIENSRLIQGKEFNESIQVKGLIEDPTNHCVVLFPGPAAFNLSVHTQEEIKTSFPQGKRLVVFVIDGTWASAGRMLRNSRVLSELPRICFTPQKPSEYKIRKQPKKHCVSTIEAVHQLLGILEPSVQADHLLTMFRAMVKLQIHYFNVNQTASEA